MGCLLPPESLAIEHARVYDLSANATHILKNYVKISDTILFALLCKI